MNDRIIFPYVEDPEQKKLRLKIIDDIYAYLDNQSARRTASAPLLELLTPIEPEEKEK